MKEEKKPRTTKRGPKKDKSPKKKMGSGLLKILQKEYDKLNEMKKEIEKKMKVHEKYCKDMGFKLSKRTPKDTEPKTKGKPGRKKVEKVPVEVKTE